MKKLSTKIRCLMAVLFAVILSACAAGLAACTSHDGGTSSLSVGLNCYDKTLEPGDTFYLEAIVTGSYSGDFEWSTSSNIVDISYAGKNCIVTAGEKTGSATVTVKVDKLSASCDFTVAEKPTVESISFDLDSDSLTLTENDESELEVVVTMSDGSESEEFAVAVSDNSVITVKKLGNRLFITATAVGTSTITVSAGGISESVTVTVTKAGENLPGGEGHTLTEDSPVWTWTGDDVTGYTAATAVWTCTAEDCEWEDDAYSAEATITSETVEPTCVEAGYTIYTATAEFEDGTKCTDTKTVVGDPATGNHAYEVEGGEKAWTWTESGESYTVTATGTCSVCGTTSTLTADVSSEVTDPTCEDTGYTTYTATYGGETVATKVVTGEPATGHSWMVSSAAGTWTWIGNDTDGYTSATATATCSDCYETTTVTANVTSASTSATCTAAGYTTYTATYGGETVDTKVVETEAARGHTYVEAWAWGLTSSDEYGTLTATLSLSCSECDYTWAGNATVTLADSGSGTYTATATNDLSVEFTATHILDGSETVIHTHNYEYLESSDPTKPNYKWSDDGTACTVILTCTNTDTTCTHQTLEVAAEIAHSTTTMPGCETTGAETYVASYKGTQISTNNVTIPATGHSYPDNSDTANVIWTWTGSADEEDISVSLTVKCKTCGNTLFVSSSENPVTVQKVDEGSYAATCTKEGIQMYRATITFFDSDNTSHTYGVSSHSETLSATNHANIQAISYQTPTCTGTGYNAFWYCPDCGKCFTDGDAATEATNENTRLAATGHSYPTSAGDTCVSWNWSYIDGVLTAHLTVTCTVCGDTIFDQNVTYSENSEKSQASTCTEDGQTVYNAEMALTDEKGAGHTYSSEFTETVAKIAHKDAYKISEHNASCTETGYNAFWYCPDCGKAFTDNTFETGATEGNTRIAVTEHTYVLSGDTEWTWTQDGDGYNVAATAICSECGIAVQAVYAEVSSVYTQPTCAEDGYTTWTAVYNGITVDERVDTDGGTATGHSYPESSDTENVIWSWSGSGDLTTAHLTIKCTACGDAVYNENVTPEAMVDDDDYLAATCTEDGWLKYSASVTIGNITYTADEHMETLAATGHNATRCNGNAATCTEEGYNDYWYCSACGKFFADEDATVAATYENIHVDALGHDFVRDSSPTAYWFEVNPDEYDGFEWWAYASATCSRCYEIGWTDFDKITQSTSAKAGCTSTGTMTYSAQIENGKILGITQYKTIDTKEVEIPATGHDYAYDEGPFEWVWVADTEVGFSSVYARFECRNCGGVIRYTVYTTANSNGVVTGPADGSIYGTWTATVYTQQDIYGNSYTWTDSVTVNSTGGENVLLGTWSDTVTFTAIGCTFTAEVTITVTEEGFTLYIPKVSGSGFVGGIIAGLINALYSNGMTLSGTYVNIGDTYFVSASDTSGLLDDFDIIAVWGNDGEGEYLSVTFTTYIDLGSYEGSLVIDDQRVRRSETEDAD